MSQSLTQETLFSLLEKYEEKLRRLENVGRLEVVHYVGGGGNDPPFTSPWVNYDNSATTPTLTAGYRNARFYKDRGRVYLDGVVKSTGAFTGSVFTLPSGYRPNNQRAFICLSNSVATYVTIETNGAVSVAGGAAYLFLDQINFLADGS